MDTTLQARIYDPLWLLARQWQFGEFEGEDNGLPIMAGWRGESARLTRYHAGAIAPNTRVTAQSYDVTRTPFETLVERETIRPPVSQAAKPEKLRLAAEAGQQFLQILSQQPLSRDYRDSFMGQFPFPPLSADERASFDSDTLNFFDLVALRVPDGRRLYGAFGPTNDSRIVIPPGLQIPLPTRRKLRRLPASGSNGETLLVNLKRPISHGCRNVWNMPSRSERDLARASAC